VDKTGKNFVHVTYLVEIKKDDKRRFTESVHSLDDMVRILFVPSNMEPNTVNANFDVLSASYVSDFGRRTKVNGMISQYREITKFSWRSLELIMTMFSFPAI
jgi:predicted methyltransferase MtxX (methanogen marker protein 4)